MTLHAGRKDTPAVSVSPALLSDLQRQLKALEADMRAQSEDVPELRGWLQQQHAAAVNAERTGATYAAWRDEQVTQAAVAWLLGTVFVRFCEDNDLIDRPWLSGPGDRAAAAAQAQTAYFLEHPTHNDRHWILAAFEHLHALAATRALFDEHNPVWWFPISADAASALLVFWRRQDAGGLVHDFTDPTWDTRFLGDLYQDLSEAARKHYALLQTPEFVEEFLLDLTLEQSLNEYGLADTSLIDPACGSGHFLLGAFHRLLARWEDEAPGLGAWERVQRALDQVTGVDLNPFAVAIARFRLTLAVLRACGLERLAQAPAFRMRLAAGDSLLRWGSGDLTHQGDLYAEEGAEFAYFTEDAEALGRLLRRGRYTVAVGNPPYITVKDKVLNQRYRDAYASCSGKYALSVPFAERLFELVRERDESGRAGFVGQITANSFMKREFGRRLIEFFFQDVSPLRPEVELTHVIDTSGAYIPGHGTPTVILAGRRRLPKSATVRAVLGILGEPSPPEDPAKGLVWESIVENIDRPGAENDYVTVADMPRESFATHPWSLSGGGAAELREAIEEASPQRLVSIADALGITAVTGEDDLYILSDRRDAQRLGLGPTRPLVEGDVVRDYAYSEMSVALWIYDHHLRVRPVNSLGAVGRMLNMYRAAISRRKRFGTPMVDRNLAWWEWQELYREKLRTPLSIAFAFVATHNHFVLDRGGKVFNRSAPVIKLPADASEDDHLELLGLLNSSTACFWLKQVSHSKGSTVDQRGARQSTIPWEDFYEFTGTKLEQFPLPRRKPQERARRMDQLAQRLAAARPAVACESETPTRERLAATRAEYERARGEMIALQEELDWEVYRLYGLLDQDLTAPPEDMPALNLGERAFEIVLARRMARGETASEWFNRHDSTPITELPSHWPRVYKDIVARRIEVIESRRDIALIEHPECKRRWNTEPWEKQQHEALRSWLLDRLEAAELWHERGRARALSVARLADLLRADAEFRSVLDLYIGRDDYDLAAELTKLVAGEAVPFLAAYRYKAEGRRKRAEWEHTWALQRREDEGEDVGTIPVPPKYKQSDFAKPAYWHHRGKLDVPKERFVLYPRAGRDADKTPVIGWAGWDVAAKAQALATLYLERQERDAWPAERLRPLLAGLAELEPWLHQWHSEPEPAYSGSPAAFYTAFLDRQLAELGYSRADLEEPEP